jgi:hypothetical protein
VWSRPGLGVEAEGVEDGRRKLPAADCAQTRSARFDLSVGWRRPVNLMIRAAGPDLSL